MRGTRKNWKSGDKVTCVSPFFSLTSDDDFGQVGSVYEVETYDPDTDELKLVGLNPVMYSRRFESVE